MSHEENSRTPVRDIKAPVSPIGRRAFIKRLGLGGAALLPMSSLLVSETSAHAEMGGASGHLSKGDAAILQFLAAVETLATDLWQQYTELGVCNEPFQSSLEVLDEDMP